MIEAKALNHIGIAVKSIAEHREYYEKVLGAVYEHEEVVVDQKVKVAFFRIGDVRLELLEPTDPNGGVAKFIEKKGEGVHHLAFTVACIEDRITDLKNAGVAMIDEVPRKGAHHQRIAFLHPKSSKGILTEMCEPSKH